MMSDIFQSIEKKAASAIPFFLSPVAKKLISYPRYFAQLKKCRNNYEKYKNKYNQHTLFVAGLPKSGTTWLEKMLSSFPGFSDVMIPEAVVYEQNHAESHSFDFPEKIFKRFQKALVVCKLHSHGSAHNFEILNENRIKYVVIYRDLRDVAVSHFFYGQRTRYHPEHRSYKNLNIKQGLHYFAKTLLPQYINWVDSWHQYVHHPLSLIIRYEDLKNDPMKHLASVAKHYGISTSEDELEKIIKITNFKKLSGGRTEGSVSTNSFFRKGISGDWINYFDDELTSLYNNLLREFNSKYKYE